MESRLRVALIGFMGSGKSLIGKELAEILNYLHVDLDKVIVEMEGLQISEIFEKHGEEYFRNLETKALMKVAKEKKVVVSCGGGIVEKEKNREILKENFFVVYLKVPFSMCYERIKGDLSRPKAQATREELFNLFKRREPFYESTAHYVFEEYRLKPDKAATLLSTVILS